MSILDKIFRRKKKVKKAEKKLRLSSSAYVKSDSQKRDAVGREEKKKTRKVVKKENIAHWVLIEPLVTEKSTSLEQFNKYVFRIHNKASKSQIREAVQDYYGVKVTAVHVLKVRPKKRIQRRFIGWKKGYKKAIVTLQPGDRIGIIEGV